MMQLEGKTAVITGGASGIGRAIAIRFAAEGARVVVADVRTEPVEGGEHTSDVIRSMGGACLFVRTDVRSEQEVDQAISRATSEFGRLDVLVNNAAISGAHPLTETTLEEWHHVMAVNLTGPFLCSRRAVLEMLRQEPVNDVRGRIVNITSQHGLIAAPRDYVYSVSKGGLTQMTRQIAVDYAASGIICNSVAPGKVLTGKSDWSTTDGILTYSHARTPLRRLGAPNDVANAATFLASDQSTFITGANLLVDGGWMAG